MYASIPLQGALHSKFFAHLLSYPGSRSGFSRQFCWYPLPAFCAKSYENGAFHLVAKIRLLRDSTVYLYCQMSGVALRIVFLFCLIDSCYITFITTFSLFSCKHSSGVTPAMV